MKRVRKNILGYSVLAALALSGCSRDEEMLGPAAHDVFTPFELEETLTVSQDSADFSDGATTVHFGAKFNVIRDWTITIRGDESGIVKTINGTSSEINADNSTWNGNSDVPAFGSEEATVTLTTSLGDTTLSLPFKVLGGKPLDEGGLVVQTFDGTFTGAIMDQADSTYSVKESTQGGIHFTMVGIDRNSDYWIGEQSNTAKTGLYAIDEDVTEEDLYFNIYIYGYGKPETQIEISFKEADADEPNDVYLGSDDDIFSYKVEPNWTGWRLISFKYSEAERSINAGLGDKGNGVREPSRINTVTINLLAKNGSPTSIAKFSMDYAVFTVGGPLVY